ncbi:MAG: hypothetical protein HY051_02070 [Candidatus Aenigmarchaeota archaeon]|nr:hypothetical protein [Candidatus Aenigmarchaeota archaeon]
MVTVKSFDGKEVFACDECGFKYADKETATECERFCKTHKSCNPKITALALAR